MVADFNKKEKGKFFSNQLLFKTVGIIFLVFVAALMLADFRIYQKKQELISQIKSYQKQIEDIKKNSQTLKDEIANSNNTDYLEKIGYEQFNETRPGETEYMFIGSEKKAEAPVQPNNFWVSFSSSLNNSWNWLKSKF